MTLRKTRIKVNVAGERSPDMPIERGLKQGDHPSCVLFNLTVRRKISINRGGTQLSRSAQYLDYAHDGHLVVRERSDGENRRRI